MLAVCRSLPSQSGFPWPIGAMGHGFLGIDKYALTKKMEIRASSGLVAEAAIPESEAGEDAINSSASGRRF
jgi:hypothetical protein